MQSLNKFQSSRKTIGVLINRVEGRYQTPVCEGISQFAQMHDINVFFFNGRALNSPLIGENLQNIVYNLVNTEKLNGLIISAGSLANYCSDEEMLDYIRTFTNIPIVCLSSVLEGLPCVVIKNSGMTDIMDHLIEVHGYRSIAFVKGQNNNMDALERYAAYCSSLIKHNIPYNPAIVFEGDFNAPSGRAALEALEQSGEHVDAIVASNDVMAISIYQGLEERGVRIPEQMAVTGFDDIDSASQLYSPLTTVHQPIFEMAWKAADILTSMMEGEIVPEVTYMPERLMIRESCGCYLLAASEKFDSHINEVIDRNLLEIGKPNKISRELMADKIVDCIDFPPQKVVVDKAIIKRDLTSVLQSLDFDISERNSKPMTLLVLTEILKVHMISHEDISYWQQIFAFTRQLLIRNYPEPKQVAHINDIFERSQIILGDLMERRKARKEILLDDFILKMRDIISLINYTFDLTSLSNSLFQHLPGLGIKRGYIALYHKTEQLNATGKMKLPLNSDLIVGFDERGLLVTADKPRLFFTRHILPASIVQDDSRYSLIIMPLLNTEEQFGFMALESSSLETIAYDILREQISNGLYTISLFNIHKKTQDELAGTIDNLRKSEEKFREIAMLSPTIILETDLKLKIQYMNKAASGMFTEADTDQPEYPSLLDLIHSDDHSRLKDYLNKSTSGDNQEYIELRFVRKENDEFRLLAMAIPITKEGLLIGFNWNAIDLKPVASSIIAPEEAFFTEFKIRPREREVILLMMQGYKIREIAEKLFISESTVKGHMNLIYQRTSVQNKSELFDIIRKYQVKQFGYQTYIFSLLNKLVQE